MSGAHIAIAHAIKKKRQEEEETMGYNKEELENDWEFKILRSVAGKFKKLAIIEQVKAEEAVAGWVMVEIFDDNRIRFKRPGSAIENDFQLPPHINPYRTTFGKSEAAFTFSILAVLAVIFGVMLLIGTLTGNM